tara:strand:- start:1005 stop:1199 length:195 start_codon:yes stop_codon:yes gene_type:complete
MQTFARYDFVVDLRMIDKWIRNVPDFGASKVKFKNCSYQIEHRLVELVRSSGRNASLTRKNEWP